MGRKRIYDTPEQAKQAVAKRRHDLYRSLYVKVLNHKGIRASLDPEGQHLLVEYAPDNIVLDLYNAHKFLRFFLKKDAIEKWYMKFRELEPTAADSWSGSLTHWILLKVNKPERVPDELLFAVADDCTAKWMLNKFEPFEYEYKDGVPAKDPDAGKSTRVQLISEIQQLPQQSEDELILAALEKFRGLELTPDQIAAIVADALQTQPTQEPESPQADSRKEEYAEWVREYANIRSLPDWRVQQMIDQFNTLIEKDPESDKIQGLMNDILVKLEKAMDEA